MLGKEELEPDKDLDSKDIHDTIREKLKWWRVVRKWHYLTERGHVSSVIQRTEFLAGSPRIRASFPPFSKCMFPHRPPGKCPTEVGHFA